MLMFFPRYSNISPSAYPNEISICSCLYVCGSKPERTRFLPQVIAGWWMVPLPVIWARWLLVATSLDAIRIGLADLRAVLRSEIWGSEWNPGGLPCEKSRWFKGKFRGNPGVYQQIWERQSFLTVIPCWENGENSGHVGRQSLWFRSFTCGLSRPAAVLVKPLGQQCGLP